MKLLAFLNLDWQRLDLHIILCTFLYFETFSNHKVLKTLYKHGCLYKPELLKPLLINFKKTVFILNGTNGVIQWIIQCWFFYSGPINLNFKQQFSTFFPLGVPEPFCECPSIQLLPKEVETENLCRDSEDTPHHHHHHQSLMQMFNTM